MRIIEFGKGYPKLSIIGGIHGDEPSGKQIIRLLDTYLSTEDLNGSVKLILANEEALDENIRYIDVDMNRSFPGDEDSEIYEEQLAAEIFNEIRNSDAVLALHATRSSPPPFVIYSSLTENNKKSIRLMGIDYAVDCSDFSENTLDSHFDDAITLECGEQHSESAIDFGFKASKNFLRAHNVLTDEIPEENIVRIVKAKKEIPKGNGEPKIYYRNFEKITKGTLFAEDDDYKHKINDADYVPILASVDGYENIYGLLGKFTGELI